MLKSHISQRAIRETMKEASPGFFTQECIDEMHKTTVETIMQITRDARIICNMAGRSRIAAEDIRYAKKHILKS